MPHDYDADWYWQFKNGKIARIPDSERQAAFDAAVGQAWDRRLGGLVLYA